MSVAAEPHGSLKNHLLAALPDDESARVQSKLKPISFNLGDVLYESGDKPAIKWITLISRRR